MNDEVSSWALRPYSPYGLCERKATIEEEDEEDINQSSGAV